MGGYNLTFKQAGTIYLSVQLHMSNTVAWCAVPIMTHLKTVNWQSLLMLRISHISTYLAFAIYVTNKHVYSFRALTTFVQINSRQFLCQL